MLILSLCRIWIPVIYMRSPLNAINTLVIHVTKWEGDKMSRKSSAKAIAEVDSFNVFFYIVCIQLAVTVLTGTAEALFGSTVTVNCE